MARGSAWWGLAATIAPTAATRLARCWITVGAAVACGGGGLLGAQFGSGEYVTQLLDFCPQLQQRDDAGAQLLVLEENPLAEDVDCDDLLRPDRCSQGLSLLGEALSGGDVEIMLVFEAAEQPAASARDLGWVQ